MNDRVSGVSQLLRCRTLRRHVPSVCRLPCALLTGWAAASAAARITKTHDRTYFMPWPGRRWSARNAGRVLPAAPGAAASRRTPRHAGWRAHPDAGIFGKDQLAACEIVVEVERHGEGAIDVVGAPLSRWRRKKCLPSAL